MLFRTHQPPPPLSSYVEWLWFYEGLYPPHRRERVLPDGSMELVGYFKDSTPEKPKFDVQRWERALNGRAVRILHSVNNGSYGGESIIVPDPKTTGLEFYYFTTAAFTTRGTIEFKDGKLITHEEVTRNEDGITKVKGTTELLPGGKMRVLTQYYKNGAWENGRDMTYEEAPGAQVLFK